MVPRLTAIVRRLFSAFFNTRAGGLYLVIFALSIAIATFIENDFGTSAAQKVVYHSWWFTALLICIGITIVISIIKFRMVQQKKWALLTFHAAIIVILIGAAVTRYFGFEGIMHIRENQTSNTFLSSETYLQFKVIKNEVVYEFDEPVLFASLGNNNWQGFYQVGQDLITVRVLDFIPNPHEVIDNYDKGRPIIKIVIGGQEGREEYFIESGEVRRIGNTIFNFSNDDIPGAVDFAYRNDSLLIRSEQTLTERVMATQHTRTLNPHRFYDLKLRSLYSDGIINFVVGDFNAKGNVIIKSDDAKVRSESVVALSMAIDINGKKDTLSLFGSKGVHGKPASANVDGLELYVDYGAKHISLPFSIMLYDFIMERYPGTDNPASYASEVQLIDHTQNIHEDHRIYMNHILNYEGYRFFQSSFDDDELGTYLSVNHDPWGSKITYFGYALLTIGMLLTLVSRKSRFYELSKSLQKLRSGLPATSSALIVLLTLSFSTSGQDVTQPHNNPRIISAHHADRFSRIIVQDQNGRMKPMHTLNREVMRKLARKEDLEGFSADQIVLGMFANGQDWIDVQMISIGTHPKIHTLLGQANKVISYKDFFTQQGEYILGSEVQKAYNMRPTDRGVYEKELLKIDERVNIANMVYSGALFRIIPVGDDPNNTWISNESSVHHHHDSNQNDQSGSSTAERFFEAYRASLFESLGSADYRVPENLLQELETYQKTTGAAMIPSSQRVNAEILLNNLNLFNRLAAFYTIVGIALLYMLFSAVFRPNHKTPMVYKILLGSVIAGFVLHTVGLGLRWYVSERAPWSNGYESMIYIAWTTLLAGILFARKSYGGLAATMIISATVLLVAMLSYMDPEITPLVPVLKSYWLTIHVSMEAGSYGFLMLGALIGLINLILMTFLTGNNKERIQQQIREMSYLSEMTLIGGVFMISIGTYLGGVWANESWGRYWGWDAKETWALVTILIYAFILHMRIIPRLQGLYAYNFATIFGLASVIMTYYGVNYYLSGLHSYAAGDPVPIPKWVFIVVTAIVIISILAFRKKKMFQILT